MRSHIVLVLLSSLGLFACGGAKQNAEVERNPWGNFTGKYSDTEAPREKAERAESSNKEAEPKADEEAAAPEAAAPEAAAPAAAARAPTKVSQGTVKGESISSVSVEALSEVSSSALESPLVSNGVIIGPQYELLQVELKTAMVQVIRPAAKPKANGLPVPAPKAKNAELEPNDVGWFDEEADVLVIVNASKKAAAQKAIGTIVKRP